MPTSNCLPLLIRVSGTLAVLMALALPPLSHAASAPTRMIVRPVDDGDRVILAETRARWAADASDSGAVPAALPMTRMALSLLRPEARQRAFEQLLRDQQDPQSPHFQHWLTATEIGERFGPAQEDIDTLSSWLTTHGFTVGDVNASRTRIRFSGTAATVADAFQAPLHYLQKGAEKRISSIEDPSIPAALSTVVRTITGLGRPSFRPLQRISAPKAALTGPSSPRPALTDCRSTPCENFLFPADFATIYGANAVPTMTGTGQSIAIVARTRVYEPDIANFRTLSGLGASVPTVIIPPGSADPGAPASTCSATGTPSCSNPDDALSDQSEATLDVERAGGTAPGAAIKLIVADDSPTASGIQDAIEYVIDTTPPPANILSISYLGCESDNGAAVVHYLDDLFAQAAAEGISVFVASGDAGAAGCADHLAAPPAVQTAGTNALCSSGHVTCVGGTQFADTAQPALWWSQTSDANYGSAIGYIPEGAWNEPLDASGVAHLGGTGGGVSLYIAKPAWQVGPGVPGNAGRYTPDVSFSAAAHDGYFVCFAAGNGSCAVSGGGFNFLVSAGTSASAPSMAGIAARLNQKVGSPQGNLNPRLYALAANPANRVFHDATPASSGVTECSLAIPSLCNNSTAGPTGLAGGLQGFSLDTGFDLATGLGSIHIGNLLAQWSVPQSVAVNLVQRGLSGTWANPETDGQGFVMEVSPEAAGAGSALVFSGWYTYDLTAPGGQRWYTTQGYVGSGASASLPIYETVGGLFNSAQATSTVPVGAMTMRFSDCAHGTLDYHFDDLSRPDASIPIVRLLPNVTCSPSGGVSHTADNYLLGGTWADTRNSGQGLVFDIGPSGAQNLLFAGWYTYLHDGSPTDRAAGQHWYTLQAAASPSASTWNDVGIYQTTGGVFDRPAATTTLPVGTTRIDFHSCSSATMSYTFTAGENTGLSGTLELSRITPVPTGCRL